MDTIKELNNKFFNNNIIKNQDINYILGFITSIIFGLVLHGYITIPIYLNSKLSNILLLIIIVSISQYNIILSVILGILYIILNTNKAKFEHFSNDDDEDDDDDDDDDEDNEDIDNNDDADDSTNDSVDNNSKDEDEDEDEYKDKDIEQLNSSNNNNCIRNCLSQNISDNCKDFCNVPIEHDDQTDIDNSNNIIKNAKRNRNEINRLKKKMMKSSKNI